MMLRPLLHQLRDGFLDLVFAPACVACGGAIPAADGVRVVCRVCWSRARPLPAPNCPRCWEPVPAGGQSGVACTVCASLPPGLRALRSGYRMDPPVGAIVHALKYRGWEVAAGPMGERMARIPLPADVAAEARQVVPVPVSDARLRQRGYNQAALLAESFARARRLETAPELLVRTRATETQTALHPDERRANVAGAFAVPAGRVAQLRHEHLLLVDDVWTTGATAQACALALLEAGARAVSVVTFARALTPTRLDTAAAGTMDAR